MDSASRDRLALVLAAPGQPLEALEAAAAALADAGDRRSFETLALLLNHRDEARARRAAHALSRLGDPRTGRAAAALATNALRVGYAAPAIDLLVRLRSPEAVGALTETLERLLSDGGSAHARIASACVEGLRTLGKAEQLPPAALRALTAAAGHLSPGSEPGPRA